MDKALFAWLVALYPVWARLTPESLRLAARVALAELLLSGTTTTSDHHYVFRDGLDQAIDIEVEEARATGHAPGRHARQHEPGQGCRRPAARSPWCRARKPSWLDSERLIGRYHDAEPGAMVQIALAPCSPFSVTESLMRSTATLAARHGVRLHTHLRETQDEEAFCRERFGCRPVDYLERVGWLTTGPGWRTASGSTTPRSAASAGPGSR